MVVPQMEQSHKTSVRVGDWRVDPRSGEISRKGEMFKLEARTMRLLQRLAEKPGEVVSTEDLLNHVWPEVFVSQDSVYQAVAALRRVLGDDPKRPTYIETVPRLGYRMVARVEPWTNGVIEDVDGIPKRKEGRRWKFRLVWAGVAVLFVLLIAAFAIRGRVASKNSASAAAVPIPEKSIAVVPFLDLTEGMKEEEFADGLTEELIDRLSKIPGMHVPPPTSSFHYKNKHVSVAEVARALGVAYVLDGSTRKSGDKLRVAARLVRADSTYVVWSETYDRPWGEMLKMHDEIAGEILKAVRGAIDSRQKVSN